MAEMVRVSEPAQIDAVAVLAAEIWTEHYVPIIGQEQVSYMLRELQSASAIAQQIDDGYTYYLAMLGDELAGYFAIFPGPSGSSLQLSKIYVRAAQRQRGLGKAIMRFVEARCAALGVTELWLTVNRHNADSIAFYERMGFTSSESFVQDIGNGFVMDDFKLVKSIG